MSTKVIQIRNRDRIERRGLYFAVVAHKRRSVYQQLNGEIELADLCTCSFDSRGHAGCCGKGRSQAACELCKCWIAALAGSRMKARQPNWHLICRDCFNRFFPELKKHCGEVKWGGRFRTEEQARKVLPR